MGGVVKAFCKNCKYKQDNLSLGHGFDFTRGSLMPANCESCDKLHLADIDKDENLCKVHKTPLKFYHGEESLSENIVSDKNFDIFEWKGTSIKKADYLCPKCKTFSMHFKDKGIDWD